MFFDNLMCFSSLSESETTMSEKKSIASFVLATFDVKPSIGTEDLISKVKDACKKGVLKAASTKFQATHVAWYRYQVRKGIYKTRVKPATLKEMSLGTPQKALKA